MALIAAHHNAGVTLVVTVHSVRYSLPLHISFSSELTRRETSLTSQPTKTLCLSLSLSVCLSVCLPPSLPPSLSLCVRVCVDGCMGVRAPLSVLRVCLRVRG